MNGVLIIDKPAGLTSHDVVARVRGILRTRAVGHTGTLDPFATGVMVLLIGNATRLARFLDKDEKEYIAQLRFGSETDTGDLTGSVTVEGRALPSLAVLLNAASSFEGHIEQVPPMYSAKKVDGKKLYESARKGIEVERKAAAVEIKNIVIDQGSAKLGEADSVSTVSMSVVCSAGTYIRTLAEDIARAAHSAAHLVALRRTRSGRFSLADAISLSALGELERPDSRLLPTPDAVSHLRSFTLDVARTIKTKNGLSTRVLSDTPYSPNENVRMETADGELIAIGVYNADENTLQPKVVLS